MDPNAKASAIVVESAIKESIYFGRVWVIYGTLMSYVPFYVHSLAYFKIVAFTSLTLNVVMFYSLLKRLFSSQHFAFRLSPNATPPPTQKAYTG